MTSAASQTRSRTLAYQPTSGELTEARSWIADCQWSDDTSGLTDAEVTRGIARHYDGGWPAFIADGA